MRGGVFLYVSIFVYYLAGMAMVVFAYLSGDTKSYEFLVSAIDEPAFLGSLEQMIVSSPLILVGLGSILVVLAPLIEETLKGIPLLAFVWPKSRQNERLAVLLGVAGGVGFAFAENIGYISVWAEEWALIFWFRMVVSMVACDRSSVPCRQNPRFRPAMNVRVLG